MKSTSVSDSQMSHRSRLCRWLRRVHSEMTLTRPERRLSRPFEMLMFAFSLAVLALILFPVFAHPRSYSGQSCPSNLRQICVAMRQYAEDYDGVLPPSDAWMDQVSPYNKNSRGIRCPNVARETGQDEPIRYGYACNSFLSNRQANAIDRADTTPLCYDSFLMNRNAHALGRSGLAMPPRHGSSKTSFLNFMVFLDGHAGRVDARGAILKPEMR